MYIHIYAHTHIYIYMHIQNIAHQHANIATLGQVRQPLLDLQRAANGEVSWREVAAAAPDEC